MAKFYTPTKLSENIAETPEGFLLCLNVPIARTGEMAYAENETPLEGDSEGKVLIYRDADEVFRVETITSFEGKPITIRHPDEFVDPSNWSYLAKGIIQNVRKADEKDENGQEVLMADLLVTDALAIGLIKNGLREVSCGYEAEYEQMGEGKGRQTSIVGNHLALVESGRAGQSYAINDHKGNFTMESFGDKLKKFFGKAVDEAMSEEKKDKSKDEDKDMSKGKDEDKDTKEEKKQEGKDEASASYDELVKMVKDLGEKLEAMSKPKDEMGEKDKPVDEDKKEKSSEEESQDEDPKMEERLKALEAAVAKLLDKGKPEDEEPKKVGDSAFKKTGLELTKNSKAFEVGDNKNDVMTPEKMNELNAVHWARK